MSSRQTHMPAEPAFEMYHLLQIAARIDRPFALVPLGLIGDLAANLYVSQGQIEWHRHIDEDEIFVVCDGTLELETELGNAALHQEEVMLVPKGVGHRSRSPLRSVVLLLRQQLLTERKNGHRRLLVTDSDSKLTKRRMASALDTPLRPYQPVSLATIETTRLTVCAASGDSADEHAPPGGVMTLALRERVSVTTGDDEFALESGSLVFMPGGTAYKLSAEKTALVVRFQRD